MSLQLSFSKPSIVDFVCICDGRGRGKLGERPAGLDATGVQSAARCKVLLRRDGSYSVRYKKRHGDVLYSDEEEALDGYRPEELTLR